MVDTGNYFVQIAVNQLYENVREYESLVSLNCFDLYFHLRLAGYHLSRRHEYFARRYSLVRFLRPVMKSQNYV